MPSAMPGGIVLGYRLLTPEGLVGLGVAIGAVAELQADREAAVEADAEEE